MHTNPGGRAASVNGSRQRRASLSPVRGYFLLPLALLALLVSGCLASTPPSTPTPAATATPQPTALPPGVFPAFGDWRLAYVGSQGKLHIISLDGKTDLTSPVLNGSQAVISPDGRAIATADGVLNLRPAASGEQIIPVVDGRESSWSPDSTQVVFNTHDAQGDYYWEVLNTTTQKTSILPGDGTAPWQGEVIGWIDATHLAVDTTTDDGTAIILSAMDSTTGALRKIASISRNDLGDASFILSPDGSEILLTNYAGEGVGFLVPVAELIDTSTGEKHRLPTILSVTGGGFLGLIWKAGSHLALIVSTTSYLLDLANDTATPFAKGVTPLGWAPDTGTLYTSTAIGTVGTFQVSAMAAPPPATATEPLFQIESTTLLLGFVRSA